MIIEKLDDMHLGWFIGNFRPAVHETADFEVCVKYFKGGDSETRHYQKTAKEITCLISGEARINGINIKPGDIVTIQPMEPADFEALSDVSLVAIKFPSIPSDKVLA